MTLSNIDMEDSKNTQVVLFFIVIGAIFCFITENLLPNYSSIQVISIGYITWALIYLIFLFNFFWIFPKENYAVVLQDNLIHFFRSSNTRRNESHIDGMGIPDGQRVLSRFGGKWPWETMVGNPIHMFKIRPIKGMIKVQDKNGNMYEVDFSAPLTPVPGRYAVRYLLVDDGSAEEFFRGMFISYIQSEFKKQDGDEVTRDLSAFRDKFKDCFGGPDEICNDERRQGRYTGKPVIISVIKDKALADSEQATLIASNYAKAVKQLVDQGANPNMALATIMGQNTEMVNVSGSLPGITPAAQQINQQNQNKRKKGRNRRGNQ